MDVHWYKTVYLSVSFIEHKVRANLKYFQSPVEVVKRERPSGTRVKTPRAKDVTPKSSKSAEAARQREEARKRLLEAKKKGRERKASQSKDEEIEIFVAQE